MSLAQKMTVNVQVRGRVADDEGGGGLRVERSEARVFRNAAPGSAQGLRLEGPQLCGRD